MPVPAPVVDPPGSRLFVDGTRLRIDDVRTVQVDLPLAGIEHLDMRPMHGHAVLDIRLRVEVLVGGWPVEPGNVPSVVDAVVRAWRVARGADPLDPVPEDRAPVPEPVEPPVVEAPKPLRGPELVGHDGWLMLEPLPDTRNLSCGELLAIDDPR